MSHKVTLLIILILTTGTGVTSSQEPERSDIEHPSPVRLFDLLADPAVSESVMTTANAVANDEATDTVEPISVIEPETEETTSLVAYGCDIAPSCSDRCGTCTNCCEDPCYRRCSPWYGYAESVFYDRNNTVSNQVLVVDENPFPPAPLFRAGDFNFDYEPGVRAVLGRRRGPCAECSAWEVGYLGIFDWNDSAVITGTDDRGVAGPIGVAVNNFTGAERIQLDYDSELHSIEANCVKCRPCGSNGRIEFLGGVRWLSLDEEFNLLSTDDQQSSTQYNVRTDNDLVGSQIGLRLRRWFCGKWEAELESKAGVYANWSEQEQYISPDFLAGAPFRSLRSDDDDDIAFLGEVNFSMVRRLTRGMSVRGGYNLLWLEGIALAPDQIDLTNTPTSGSVLNAGGSLFAHGFSLGGELTW